ncbi:hypothetical protein SAMN05660284_01480 [Formivibrio citricus]|uniref:DUF6129 domain-containing protein n=1 Tax=Formivibrio citricus TaxID=83765 RepID=A0A1I4Z1H6_9NEIS|nr:DUF6129 family protein [Formivibrio citricus]SFN43750.1 hypothetical protein SAMN05660284_01480 [Formivibrio citricus]
MIAPELIETVCQALAGGNARRPGIDRELREAFPGIAFSLCDDNDIPSRHKPLTTGEGFALYGIGSNGHCATLTSDPESASGLAIALTDDDDED